MQNNCDSNRPNSSDSTDTHSSTNDGRSSSRGVLIKRILMSRDKAYIGQSVAISVKTHNNSEKKTYVSINGTLGAQQYLQFGGYPGKRTIIINVYSVWPKTINTCNINML